MTDQCQKLITRILQFFVIIWDSYVVDIINEAFKSMFYFFQMDTVELGRLNY